VGARVVVVRVDDVADGSVVAVPLLTSQYVVEPSLKNGSSQAWNI
jgi:hypothetical protein